MNDNPSSGEDRIGVQMKSTTFSVAPGGSITIPIVLSNQSSIQDVFELQIMGIPSEWITVPHPTLQLSPDQHKEVTLTIQPPPPPRGRAGRYPIVFVVTSQEDPEGRVEMEAVLTVAAYEVQGRIGVLVEATGYTVPPGESTDIRMMLRNQGSQDDSFEISLDGVPVDWVSIGTPIISLLAGEEKETTITIQPPHPPQIRAGRYPITVRIFSQESPDEVVDIGVTLTVAAYEVKGRIGVLMEATQFSVSPGASTSIPIVLLNQGLAEDFFKLAVEGIPVNWISTPSPITQLNPGDQKEITLTVQPPRSSHSRAGRHSLSLRVISQQAPEQVAEVECTLTVSAFSKFQSELRPIRIETGQTARVMVENQGNIQEIFNLIWQGDGADLEFEPTQTQTLRVSPGEVGAAGFQAKPLNRPILGGEVDFPFSAVVQSTEKEEQAHKGVVLSRAWIPIWVIPVVIVLCMTLMCISIYLFTKIYNGQSDISSATQTASANQTAAAIIGEEDSDGDGLTNREEGELGTDPYNPDSDGDQLLDGPEVKQYGTNPLNPDTDADVLNDGDEVQRGTDPLRPDTDNDVLNDGDEVQRGTDPLNPDTDADDLRDGQEVQIGTDPLKPDTDDDKLPDGQEVQLGTDPLNPDTDNDRLIDGDESPPCPDPLNPDTDGDGIIDGLDLDPCDPANPSMTASAIPPSATIAPPTEVPTGEPTEPSNDLGPGTIAFESNRDGNAEIYVMDTQSFAATRLTNDASVDTQPAWSSDGNRIAFASNRSGNFEVYVMNADGSNVINITNNELGDDLYPAWSPDGNWIAFSTNRDGNQEVYITELDGPGIHNLSNNPGVEDYQPQWFKSGGILFGSDLIVFTSDRDGNPEIYRMKSDGSEQTRLTDHPATDNYPSGSPDGNRILFVSERDGNPEVYLMDVDGGDLSRMTNNPAADNFPTWLHNGDWIAFTTTRDGPQEIYVLKIDASQLFNITSNPAEDLYPSWR